MPREEGGAGGKKGREFGQSALVRASAHPTASQSSPHIYYLLSTHPPPSTPPIFEPPAPKAAHSNFKSLIPQSHYHYGTSLSPLPPTPPPPYPPPPSFPHFLSS